MPIQVIQSQEYIGDSLTKINNNFVTLDTNLAALSSISFRADNATTVTTRTLPTTTTKVLSVYNGSTYVGYVPLY